MQTKDSQSLSEHLLLAMLPVGIALNLALGGLVNVLKLPIYLDAVGTIVVTMLVGWKAGALVGMSSFALASILISPVYIYFVGTQAAIAVYVHLVGRHFKAFTRLWRCLLAGIGLGVVAGCVSAPVVAGIFNGATGSGRDVITALLVGTGHQVFKAVLLSGAASEPLDKTIQLMLGYSLVRACPKRVLMWFPRRVPIGR